MTKDEALKMALEAIEFVHDTGDTQTFDMCYADKAIAAIKEALAQEQEPVKDWIASHNDICDLLRQAHDALALTSYPPQRTWVGLTEDDKVLIKHDANFNQFMTAGEYADRVQALTEARIKDKNT